jgi:hypothetical protein
MDLKRIKQVEEGEYNPFTSLGIEPWLIQSLPRDSLKRFLGDYKKYFLGKYHHPDKYIVPEEKKKHEAHFQRVAGEIDELLSDDFYFRHCLANFRETGGLDPYKRRINRQDIMISGLKKTREGLEAALKTSEYRCAGVESELAETSKDRRRLYLEEEIFPLNKGKRYSLLYLSTEGTDLALGSKLGKLFSEEETPDILDREGRRISSNIFQEVLKSEGNKNRERLKRDWKIKNRTNRILINGGNFKGGEVIGSLPYFALRQYLSSHEMGLVSNEEGMDKEGSLKKNTAILSDFCFKSIDLNRGKKTLNGIYPFLSPFIANNVPILARFDDRENRKWIDSYKLILPTRIHQL